MDLKILILGGYGQFVWPAFIFTFLSCLIFYLKTKKELQKQEKMFLIEYKQLHKEKIRVFEGKKITKEVLSARKKFSTYCGSI
tara:strand:- start:272 stop:520 length:249 start_codon:yes stop_codon:yes gene_type:complete